MLNIKFILLKFLSSKHPVYPYIHVFPHECMDISFKQAYSHVLHDATMDPCHGNF